MPRAAEAREWWADVEDVRERIERRRERERRARSAMHPSAVPAVQRGVREIRPGRRLVVVSDTATATSLPRDARRRPRRRVVQVVGPRPDRVAAWAVALGFLLVLAAIFSAHG
jgi:hypothetical protein